MDDIVIRYWSPHGRQEETKFRSGHSKIDLVMRAAKRIDLTNLRTCNKLESLDLSNNMLETLDLTPVSFCSTLKEVNLRNNHLTTLDLWPLVYCSSLCELDLSENRIHSIDYSPIFLRTRVKLDSSVVIQVDHMLRYVFTNEELAERIHLRRSDGAPWSAIPVIIWNDHRVMSRSIDWSTMKERMILLMESVPKDKWFNCQRGLLQSLGFSELSGYDGNPLDLIETTSNNMSYTEARNAIYDRTIELLELQLANEGSTIFLDIEKMKNTRASKIIPLIVELRKKEVENTIIQTKGSEVYLMPLLLTHYGLTIIKAMKMTFTTDSEGWHKIKTNFEELGLDLQTKKVQSFQPSYSEQKSHGMRKYAFNYAQGLYD